MPIRITTHKNSPSITWMLLAVFFVVLLQRITINTDASATGNFSVSSAAYVVAGSTLILIFSAFVFYSRGFALIHKNSTNISILLFYIFAALTSITSLLPLLSAFRAVSGVGIVLAAAAYGRYIAKRMDETFESQIFLLAFSILVAYSVGSAIFQTRILGAPLFPLRGGMGAAIAFCMVVWKFIDFSHSRRSNDLFYVVVFCIIATSLNSASAIIAFLAAMLLLQLVNGRYLFFTIGLIAMISFLIGFIAFLEANIDSIIFNKPARAYLIGTGRFPLFEYAAELYWRNTPIERQIFGYGFMAERELLQYSELSWTTNLHNSMLSNLLGTGLIGFLLAAAFLISPFVAFRTIKKKVGSRLANKWIGTHLIFMFFGLTSADYPNSPSWLLLLFLALNSGVFYLSSESKNTARA